MPKPGDTLRYDIHVDGHAETGDIRLFFFHYDCHIGDRLMLTVREGQAGFFTDEELDASGGVLWRAEDETPKPDARLDPAPNCTEKRSFTAGEIDAFVAGDAYACFGSGFELAAVHTRTPNTTAGRMKSIDRISEFDPTGGPWGRGYLRAETHVPIDAWFYEGHFKNDPCMPGNLMADASVQVLSFALAALGFTIHRDGWTFEPVTNQAFKFICRGQVVPDRPHNLTYEVFIEEIIDGDMPMISAAILCSSDGFKVFQCRSMGVRLVPGWPLSTCDPLLLGEDAPFVVDPEGDVQGDYKALLACGWGSPSEAFGSMYKRFDNARRVPRLPGPPYHFISRITEVSCPSATPTQGATLVAEYNVPPDAWYFQDNSWPVMPFSVFVEVLLQPCGWLSSYMGFALSDNDLVFRNLDGDDAIVHGLIRPDTGTLTTNVTLTRFSSVGDMTIVFFRVECHDQTGLVYNMNTSFGFFSAEALAKQVGLSTTDADRARRIETSDVEIDLKPEPSEFFSGQPRLAGGKLRMLDAISGYWPNGGEAGLGRIRGHQDVDPTAWYFKAHFYQDPVQPGSLGLEALVQLLQAFTLQSGLGKDITHPRFEPIASGEPLIWKYRGQVSPSKNEVTTELEITSIEEGPDKVTVVAKGSLWVDGLRVYEVENMAVRIVSAVPELNYETWHLNAETMPWIADHRPTYTAPTLPMMAGVAFALEAAAPAISNLVITGVEEFTHTRWLAIPDGETVDLRVALGDKDAGHLAIELTSGENNKIKIAVGRLLLEQTYPEPPETWANLDTPTMDDPYEERALFHGPVLQVAHSFKRDKSGASFLIDNKRAQAVGLLALLDGALHGIPHGMPEIWFGKKASGLVGYPRCLRNLNLYGPVPQSDELRVEVRAKGLDEKTQTIQVGIQIVDGANLWCEMTLDEILLPKGAIGSADAPSRYAFMHEKNFVESIRLSELRGNSSILEKFAVQGSNWLPSTMEATYGTSGTLDEITRDIAAKEHVAHRVRVHPSSVTVAGDIATCKALPGTEFHLNVESKKKTVTVTEASTPTFNPSWARYDWRRRLGVSEWPIEEIYFALIRRFVGSVKLEDAEGLAAIRGKPALFLANHQVGIESLTFSAIGAALTGRPLVTIAKNEHRETWLGRLIAHCLTYPGVRLPRSMIFFDRDDQASMLTMMKELKSSLTTEGLSLMVHVDGTRSKQCRVPVQQIGSVLLDLAVDGNLPIIPVRFAGGLPVAEVAERLEYPLGYGAQDIYVGSPISPIELGSMSLGDRREKMLDCLNTLGPDLKTEEPNDPNQSFANGVEALVSDHGMPPARAAVLHAIEKDPDTSEALKQLISAIKSGETLPKGTVEEAWLGGLADWFMGRD